MLLLHAPVRLPHAFKLRGPARTNYRCRLALACPSGAPCSSVNRRLHPGVPGRYHSARQPAEFHPRPQRPAPAAAKPTRSDPCRGRRYPTSCRRPRPLASSGSLFSTAGPRSTRPGCHLAPEPPLSSTANLRRFASRDCLAHSGSDASPGPATVQLRCSLENIEAALPLRHAFSPGACSGTLRVTTDPVGQVIAATVIQSCGSTVLDEDTCRYPRNSWGGPPSLTRTVSFTYQLP